MEETGGHNAQEKQDVQQTSPQGTKELFFYKETVIVLGDVEGGKEILLKSDDYVLGLSDFEKAAKLQLAKVPSVEEFTLFQSSQVIPWEPKDLENWEKVISMLSKKVCKFENLKMPPKILLNLTTGLEEGKAAYCRGLNGIFLPRNMVEWATENFAEEERLVSHELWHIISRNLEPAVRDEVYRVINYLPFGHRLDYPPLLKERKISNPDASFMEHYIDVSALVGQTAGMLPIMFSSNATYEVGSGRTFFDYLVLAFILVKKEEVEGQERWTPLTGEGGVPVLLDVKQLPPLFWEAVGKNTSYIHHPEETIADNFMHLILGHKNQADIILNPELLDKLAVLLGGSAK